MTDTLTTHDGTNYRCTCGWSGNSISTWNIPAEFDRLFCGGCKVASLPRPLSPTNIKTMEKKSDPHSTQFNEVVPASREIIGSKLLTALEETDAVAVLYSEEDLRILIAALDAYNSSGEGSDRSREMLIGVAQLYQEAFPS